MASPLCLEQTATFGTEGLHARPAAEIVKISKRFTSKIELVSGAKVAAARSSVKLLLLGVKPGGTVTVRAEGPDADSALRELVGFITSSTSEAPGPPAPPEPALVATAQVPELPVYGAPGAPSPVQHLAQRNNLGAVLVLLVVAQEPGWIQADLPERPNGVTGWVPAADVTLTPDPYRITVDLASRTLTFYDAASVVDSFTVAVGSPDSPTPTGSYFVADMYQLTDPGSVYGPWALGLSAFSDTYQSFGGGPGQIAIHGTDQPGSVGTYASHGCIRLLNADITTLARAIPDGTPVDVIAG